MAMSSARAAPSRAWAVGRSTPTTRFRCLVGKTLTEDSIDRGLADAVAAVAEPRTDHRGSDDYKRHIVQTFVKRILTNLAQTEQKAA